MLLLTLFSVMSAIAQSDYISYSPAEEEDRIGDLDGNFGILIVSKLSDLVITVTNADKYNVTPSGERKDKMFVYEVIIDKNSNKESKIEVSRRGDVYRTNFVAKLRPNFFRAYLIEEVQRPIRMENQSVANDAVLNANMAEVEFTTTIPDLKVICSENLNAKVSSKQKSDDKTVIITTVSIPIKVLEDARELEAKTAAAHRELEKRLVDDGDKNATDKDWELLDRLEEEKNEAERRMSALSQILISGTGTNRLSVDISDLKPRSKVRYVILLLKVEVPIDEFSAKVAEGGRLFSLRDYEGARRSFMNALKLKEAPADLLPTIRTNIAHCDSCIKYERLTIAALKRINELKKLDAVAQTDITNYYGAAVDFMKIAEKYNPCNYYAKNINTLETYIENMPLAMRFTIIRWIVDRVSAMEDGAFPNIELWAYYGENNPRLNDYSSDRKFKKMVSSRTKDYQQVGTSDANGIIDMELNRKSLPTGFFFRPVLERTNTQIVYKDMKDIMSQAVGEYNKRQFRLKMYIKK